MSDEKQDVSPTPKRGDEFTIQDDFGDYDTAVIEKVFDSTPDSEGLWKVEATDGGIYAIFWDAIDQTWNDAEI